MMDTKECTQFIMDVRRYAYNKHKETRHLYDGYPYIIHLDGVYRALKAVLALCDTPSDYPINTLYSACFTHDLIEDCRVTYNDIVDDMWAITNSHMYAFPMMMTAHDIVNGIADITYAVTNEKGKDRSQRANKKYYNGIVTKSIEKYEI